MSKYDLTLRQGKIGPDGLAIQEGWIKAYLTHPVTREYSGASMEYVKTGHTGKLFRTTEDIQPGILIPVNRY